MSNPTTFPGDIIGGGTAHIPDGLSPLLARNKVLSVASLQIFTIPWTLWRVWDDIDAVLPDTAATDDLGLIGGTFGSASPSIQSVDFGATTTTAYARAQIPLPWCFVDYQTVKLRCHAGMLVIADDACTLDVEAYESDKKAGISADLCATAAQSINSATLADKDFTITSSSLVAGDMLDVRLTVVGTDAGNAAPNITAVIGAVQLLCDVR